MFSAAASSSAPSANLTTLFAELGSIQHQIIELCEQRTHRQGLSRTFAFMSANQRATRAEHIQRTTLLMQQMQFLLEKQQQNNGLSSDEQEQVTQLKLALKNQDQAAQDMGAEYQRWVTMIQEHMAIEDRLILQFQQLIATLN